MSIAVYVHIPFCPSKCGYCDFNSYALSGEIMERTTAATIAEIRRSPLGGRTAKTIFFGGGTPTFLSSDQLLRIFEAVCEVHPPEPACEITSEANPGTVDAAKFGAMRRAGFNRISLGAQSFVDNDLLRLDRVHRAGDIERAVWAARDAGFDNLNLDLMFALPGQSSHAWRDNLERALALEPEHLSLYCLTIEPNTRFYKLHLRGQLDLPDDEEQVAMYEECVARTRDAGYLQYEISNFAKTGRECRHNLAYWRNEEYAGYGPGAVGMADFGEGRARTTNLKHPDLYSAAIEQGSSSWMEVEPLSPDVQRTEKIMLGLRMNTGLDLQGLRVAADRVQELQRRGWVEAEGSRLRLTSEGRHFCSEVALELI